MSIHRLKPILSIIIALTLVNLFFPHTIIAATYGLSITPPLLKINIKPGKTITQVITIKNIHNTDQLLVARLIPFTKSDNAGNPQIDLKSKPNWLSYFGLANSNIKLDSPFTIKSNSSEQLILTIKIPDNAAIRDIYATMLVSTYTNATSLSYQGTLVNATIGTNLLITVHPEISPKTVLKITELAPIDGTFVRLGNLYLADNLTPITFTATAKNDGSFISETKGLFKIVKKDQPVYLDGLLPFYIIANTERDLKDTKGNNFTFSPNLSHVGLFHAQIQIKTDNTNAENSIDVFFFPLKLFLGLIAAIIFLNLIWKTLRPKQAVLD